MRLEMGPLNSVRPTMATHFREATERCKSHAGVTMPSFRCVRCKCTKLIKGRKTVVKGTGKFGYHCASCVEELENEVESKSQADGHQCNYGGCP